MADSAAIMLPESPEAQGEPVETKKFKEERAELLNTLLGYLSEARDARREREVEWEKNTLAYHGRYDITDKEDWQSAVHIPEVGRHVDRFTARIRQAVKAGDWWDTLPSKSDPENAMRAFIKPAVDWCLRNSGRTAQGHPIGFGPTFGHTLRWGATKMLAMTVTWDHVLDLPRIGAVDPTEIFLDPSGRNLYRIREREMELHQFRDLKKLKGKDGMPIYDSDAIDAAAAANAVDPQRQEKEDQANHSTEIRGPRKKILVHEFYGTFLRSDGTLGYKNSICVLGGEREIIRGPVKNPWWHGRDWLITGSIIPVPGTPYGKSYVEDFAQLVQTFIDVTNLLLDSVAQTSIPVKMIWPDALANPADAQNAVRPGSVMAANEMAVPGKDFLKTVEQGRIHPEVFSLWSGVREMIKEAAAQNDLALGQLPPKGDITATEISAANQGQGSLMLGVSEDIEEGLLVPMLELQWATFVQMVNAKNPLVQNSIGPIAEAVSKRRGEFRRTTFGFEATGLTGMLHMDQMRNALMGFLSVIGQNPMLSEAFLQDYSIRQIVEQLMLLFRINKEQLKKTEKDQLMDMLRQQQAAAAGGGPGGPMPQGGGIPGGLG